MNNKQKRRLVCLKNFTPLILGFSILVGTELPASAIPFHIPLPSSNPYSGTSSGFRSISAPRSLNVTPPPGSHISLPTSNYRYSSDYYYSDCDEYGRPRRRVYQRNIRHSTSINPTIIDSDVSGSVLVNPVIVNPPVQKQPTHRRGSIVRIYD
jgi:hypothetical protein